MRGLFKIHGGKHYLSKWIISFFPDNYEKMTYVEAAGGALSVLLNKSRSVIEIVNDKNPAISNIYQVIRCDYKEFRKEFLSIEYSKETFEKLKSKDCNNATEIAIKELALRRMSRGGFKKDFSWSNRFRGGRPGEINAFETFKLSLDLIYERMKYVEIEDVDMCEVIEKYNESNCLVYADPPYVHSTRTVTKGVYEFEMSDEDHVYLSKCLNGFKGKVILSGYDSELYRKLYSDWRIEIKDVPNHSSQAKTKQRRRELLFLNF